MSEFKGTKGEWILDERECRIVLKSKAGINDICDVWGFNADTKQSVKTKMIANAKLIACAPEMLNELIETITDLKILRNQINSEVKNNHLFEGMPELMDKWIERKEKLIKKATE